ncbi:hypothetical protein BJF78_02385 [Pseudonocardia sp. CNS-139]|nr:hypothetical protein BJF78_02385 [Pseudonocardia sp. CNS-139]
MPSTSPVATRSVFSCPASSASLARQASSGWASPASTNVRNVELVTRTASGASPACTCAITRCAVSASLWLFSSSSIGLAGPVPL